MLLPAVHLKFRKRQPYPLQQTVNEIRPRYRFDETCQSTVPQAITAFLESVSFEDALRTAVSLGGDCDTLTDITCAIAWPFYTRIGPDATLVRLRDEALALLHGDLRGIVIQWEERYGGYKTTTNSKLTERSNNHEKESDGACFHSGPQRLHGGA